MGSQALAVQNGNDIISDVITKGDLANLSPEQRATYYGKVCESMGLNPLTKPFDYIELNRKLTLYATKGATDQLRKLNRVDIRIVGRDQVGDVYVVTAEAHTPDGRTDSDIGVVSIKGLGGDALANALMKATTKAKRRVTLSICGLGWLDESEVETIPSARAVAIDTETGEIVDADPVQRARMIETDAKRRFADTEDVDEKIAAGALAISARETAAILESRQQTSPKNAPGRAVEPMRDQDGPHPANAGPEPTSAATDAKTRTDDHRKNQNARYHATAADIGLNEPATKAFALAFFPHETSRTQLSGQELHDVADAAEALARLADGSTHPLVEVANAISAAPDAAELRRIATEMKAAGVGTDWLRSLWHRRQGEVPAVAPMVDAPTADGSAGDDRFTS